MKKIFLWILLFLIPLSEEGAWGSSTYRFAEYNIRLNTASDTGDRAWANRKQYVAQIVIDYAFDVCALNELKPDQKKDLLSLLPDYKIESWGRDSHIIGDVGEGVGILYRKDKFRLLSSGHFFLSPDITKSAVAWDAKFRRLAVWAQLQDKTTGDIFFYCATHLEQAGQVAKRKGAAVVVEQMLAVAGDYPCFIAGDFNSQSSVDAVHMPFKAYFQSAYDIAETTPNADGSYCNWQPTSTHRIDHLYGRYYRALSYTMITEDYGRSCTPSDHLPLMAEVALTRRPQTIPLTSSLTAAIAASSPGDTIDLGGQTVSNENIRFPHFLVLTNGSLDGCTLTVPSPYALHLSHCTFTHSSTAIAANGYALRAADCRFSDCTTDLQGAAVSSNGRLYLTRCIFSNNTAAQGGAVAQVGNYWGATLQNCVFSDNTAKDGSALYLTKTEDVCVENSAFVRNHATETGAVSCNDPTTASHLQFVNCTFAENTSRAASSFKNPLFGGSSLRVYGDTATVLTLINTTCARDTNACLTAAGAPGPNYFGAAIVLSQGNLNIYNSLIVNHYSTAAKADLYISDKARHLADVHTVYTAEQPDNAALGQITQQDDMPFVPLLKDTYAGVPLVCLLADDLSEQTFGEDITADGVLESSLTTDCLGNSRPSPATIGSVEYQAPQAIHTTSTRQPPVFGKYLYNNQICITNGTATYNLLGTIIYRANKSR